MALKRTLTKDEFSKLPEAVQAEYIEDGDGYRIDLEGGFEDTGALKRAKDREKELRKDAENKARALEDELNDLKSESISKTEHDRLLGEATLPLNERSAKLESHVKNHLIDNVALKLANEISTAPSLMLPHIKARLNADLDGEEFKTVFLGADGKPNKDLTMDALKAEFVANKEFGAIIKGTSASGTKQTNTPGGSAPNFNTNTDKNLSKMSGKELAAHIKESKESAQT